jgi:carboxymethylenebutenolidase
VCVGGRRLAGMRHLAGLVGSSGVWMLALVAMNAPAAGQDWARAALARSPRHGEFVTIAEPGGRKLEAWVVYPEVKEKAPVVVMIHEIFGLSDWAREMADEVAGAGYIVVEPDLLSGLGPVQASAAKRALPGSTKVTLSPCPGWLRAGKATSCTVSAAELEMLAGMQRQQAAMERGMVGMVGMGCDPMDCSAERGNKPELETAAMAMGEQSGRMGQANSGAAYGPASPGGTSAFAPDAVTRAVSSLPDAQVLEDLNAAADYGRKLAAANGKLFAAGFCWGGGKSFLFATQRRDLSAAFVFYGTPPAEEAMAGITAPVYGFYAGKDARVSATIPQTKVEMKAAGKVYEPVVYDGAGHGFMRLGEAPDASAENTAARQEGFRRLVGLLGGVR